MSVEYTKVTGERSRSCFELYFEFQDRRVSACVVTPTTVVCNLP